MNPVLIGLLAAYVALGALTVTGSRRRGNDWPTSFTEGLAWPASWIVWFVRDNRAAGRSWFDGHPPSRR